VRIWEFDYSISISQGKTNHVSNIHVE